MNSKLQLRFHWAAPLLASFAFHGLVLVGAVSLADTLSKQSTQRELVSIQVVDMPRGTEEEAAMPEQAATPVSPTPSVTVPKPSIATPRPADATASPTEDTEVLDLPGVVLSNTTAEGSATGTGQGSPSAALAPGGGSGQGTGPAVGTSSGLVAIGNLSRRPRPSGDIRAALERNYPRRAQSLGIQGSAQVRLRILATGQATQLVLTNQTGNYGFGDACLKTLRDSRWSPPLDRTGTPVATDIGFTCVFEIRY